MGNQARQVEDPLPTDAIVVPDALPVANDNDSDVTYRIHYSAAQMVLHSGPLPDPLTLQQYKDIDPELYGIIKEEFRHTGPHIREIEIIGKKSGSRDSLASLVIGGVLGMAALVCSTILGLHGETVAAVAVVGVPVMGFLNAFIKGSNNNKKERIEREVIRQRLLAGQRGRIGPSESEETHAD